MRKTPLILIAVFLLQCLPGTPHAEAEKTQRPLRVSNHPTHDILSVREQLHKDMRQSYGRLEKKELKKNHALSWLKQFLSDIVYFVKGRFFWFVNRGEYYYRKGYWHDKRGERLEKQGKKEAAKAEFHKSAKSFKKAEILFGKTLLNSYEYAEILQEKGKIKLLKKELKLIEKWERSHFFSFAMSYKHRDYHGTGEFELNTTKENIIKETIKKHQKEGIKDLPYYIQGEFDRLLYAYHVANHFRKYIPSIKGRKILKKLGM